MARPGQALTAAPPCGGVTVARLTARARIRPPSATPQPAYTSTMRRRASSAANAGSTRPAVTQDGGNPGPPGLSSSSEPGRSAAAASPGRTRPASAKNAEGLVTRWKVHGMRSTPGTTATIQALRTVRGPSQDQAAVAATAAITATGQASGTKAAVTAVSRPAAQAALAAVRGFPVSTRPARTPISGSSTNATTVPIRPTATAPVATGSSA